jgi:hypothetical protein
MAAAVTLGLMPQQYLKLHASRNNTILCAPLTVSISDLYYNKSR